MDKEIPSPAQSEECAKNDPGRGGYRGELSKMFSMRDPPRMRRRLTGRE